MFKKVNIFLVVILFMMPIANASEKIYAEDSIFNNVSIISSDKIKQMIEDSLIDELQSDRISVDLRSYNKGIKLNAKKDFFDVEIIDSTFNKRTRRFDYKLEFTNADYKEAVDVKGSYDEIVSIPTLSIRMPTGVVIKEGDVEYIDIAAHKLRHDTILDKSDLVGQTLKRSKSELRPIRRRDVGSQQIVQRSDNISIIYETSAITLTATGVAMDSGAKGDLIRVRNLSSNKIVQAVVKNSSMAIVNTGNL